METKQEEYLIIDQPIDIGRRLDINYLRTKLFIKLHHFLHEDKNDIYLYTYKITYLKRLFILLNNKYNNAIHNLVVEYENNIKSVDVNDTLFMIIETLYKKDKLQDIHLLDDLIYYIGMD
jgi:hypothetical protein